MIRTINLGLIQMSCTDDHQADFKKAVGRIEQAANACFVATVNQVGFEQTPGGGEGIQFWGKSFIAKPSGQLIQEASMDNEEILVCSVDLSKIEKIRTSESFPFRDRRVDSYQGLTQLYFD